MDSTTMTCACTEEVSSIVLMPTSSKAIFNVTTYRVLDDGTELSPETESETEVLTPEVLAAVLALRTTPDHMKVPVKPV